MIYLAIGVVWAISILVFLALLGTKNMDWPVMTRPPTSDTVKPEERELYRDRFRRRGAIAALISIPFTLLLTIALT